MERRASWLTWPESRGDVEEVARIFETRHLRGVYLDYGLAVAMGFQVIILYQGLDLVPKRVHLFKVVKGSIWSPLQRKEQAEQVKRRFHWKYPDMSLNGAADFRTLVELEVGPQIEVVMAEISDSTTRH